MKAEIFSFSITFLSFLGILGIFLKNYQKLVALPEKKVELSFWKFYEKIKNRVKELKFFQRTFWETYLEKSLTKMRILILKVENFLYQKAQKLKEKKKEEKEIPKISFWKKIRKLK
jgi:hypothetical protein